MSGVTGRYSPSQVYGLKPAAESALPCKILHNWHDNALRAVEQCPRDTETNQQRGPTKIKMHAQSVQNPLRKSGGQTNCQQAARAKMVQVHSGDIHSEASKTKAR